MDMLVSLGLYDPYIVTVTATVTVTVTVTITVTVTVRVTAVIPASLLLL